LIKLFLQKRSAKLIKKVFLSVLLSGIFIITVACGGHSGTPMPSPTPSPTATAVSEEFTIPEDFDTYNDESGLFSISYPEDWEVNLEILADMQIVAEEVLDNIRSGASLGGASFVFVAGFPKGFGYEPNVNIVVEPLPSTLKSIEAVASSATISIEMLADSYDEISRDFVIIDGREAAIIEYEAEIQGIYGHHLLGFTIASKTIWSVTCTASTDAGFDDYEDDFQAIVHSLKIYD
jgi:hypothetical protein